jgi:Flp pilus assembly protein protease CpaA
MSAAEWLVVVWCVVVCLFDLTTRRVPNLLSLSAVLVAIIYLLITGATMLGSVWTSALLGAVLALAVSVPGYLMGQLGAGDVKLLLAIGLIAGWFNTLLAFLIGALIAASFAIVCLIISRQQRVGYYPKKWIPFGSSLSLALLLLIGASK